jgi:hypothetical protein
MFYTLPFSILKYFYTSLLMGTSQKLRTRIMHQHTRTVDRHVAEGLPCFPFTQPASGRGKKNTVSLSVVDISLAMPWYCSKSIKIFIDVY